MSATLYAAATQWASRPDDQRYLSLDAPTASERIAAFAAGDSEWLVAVRMVSEGVDIPRLRVGVYATATTTDLLFRQAVGRFVRWQPGIRNQRQAVCPGRCPRPSVGCPDYEAAAVLTRARYEPAGRRF